MPIGGHRNVIVMLAASAALLAGSDELLVKSRNDRSVPDARRIVESSIAATQRSWQARLHYTYVERAQDQRRDSAGRVMSEDVDVSRTILVNGVPFEQLEERNGRPPSSGEERKQKEKLEKLMVETPQHRAGRLRKQEEENTSLVREVPKAFDFQLMGEEVVNGRPAYVFQATPHAGYDAQGKYATMFTNVEGKLWVDKQDLGWIKADAQVIQPFSMGLFLARVLRGSHITMEQTRVDDGFWMPERVEVRAAAKILFVKSLVIDRVLTYSKYRLAEAGVPTTRDLASRESSIAQPAGPEEGGLGRPALRELLVTGSSLSGNVMEGRIANLIGANLRNSFNHFPECLEDFWIGIAAVGVRVLFLIPQADSDNFRSTGDDERDFVLEACSAFEAWEGILSRSVA